MLYEFYDGYADALASIRLVARAANALLNQPFPLIRNNPMTRRAAVACELIAHAELSHSRREFGITQIRVGKRLARITENAIARHPFCTLQHFAKDVPVEQPRVLIVAPMSGHFATLLRDTVEAMLSEHDVFVTDWHNARNVPLYYGHFDFDDFVDLMIEFIRVLGSRVHIVAVCQSSVPVLTAVALMAAAGDPLQAATMTLIGGPIDTRRNPTRVNQFATSRPLDWFERNMIATVPARYPGAFRRVYPGFLQLAGFMTMNVERHISAHFELFRHLLHGDSSRAKATRAFYDEYTSVMDLPADFYLQTVKRVFQEFSLPLGRLTSRGRRVEPGAIERTGLLTIEGEQDNVCAVGQTVAAHGLCARIADVMRGHHVQPRAGHYGIFSGRRWRTEIYPKLRDFIRMAD
jgi:polyhydroxyalkanoate depolymerase